jgi:glutamate dehydrogenase
MKARPSGAAARAAAMKGGVTPEEAAAEAAAAAEEAEQQAVAAKARTELLAKATPESFIRLEIDRQSPQALEVLRGDLLRVLRDVRVAVEDWAQMRARAHEVAARLDVDAAAVNGDERREAAAFLQWLADDHFTFLGYREYELVPGENGDELRSIEGSGLGILRNADGRPTSHSYAKLPPDVRRRAREPNLLNLTKANSRSTVHRRSYLDYIGVKRFDETGAVVAERRFLGIYTYSVYKQWPDEIPILRRSVRAVRERAGFASDSHSGKALAAILDEYPRDELFQMSAGELYDAAMAILGLGDRQRLRLLVRHDQFGRFVSCLVYLPHERLNPALEQRIQSILRDAFHGVHLEQTTSLAGPVLVRLHLVIYTEPGSVPDADVDELEQRLTTAMRTWSEDLHDALVEQLGEELGSIAHRRYGNAFGPTYVEDVLPVEAVEDIRHMDALDESGFGVDLYRARTAENGLGVTLYRRGEPITLSGVLPVLENLGVQVVDERPYEVTPEGSGTIYVYDFALQYSGTIDLEGTDVRRRFEEAFRLVFGGAMENDSFNRLVLRAGLSARQVTILRTYARYVRQSATYTPEFAAAALADNPRLASLLVELFRVRHDPSPDVEESRDVTAKELAAEIERGLDAVSNLNQDRVIRRILGTMQATVRTNFFQRGEDGEQKEWLALKLDSRQVPGLPLPVPMYETFVCSAEMEGIHLRGGPVARGGLRWSDRLEDYRTEVLGLMKAQTVKNAVIVPVGAKGGFVVKSPVVGDPAKAAAQGVACYRTFVHGLLDITDNLVGGKIVPPEDVVRHDGDDPYLVVAADKGTATFSDIANELAAERGFWLGDAFASGGSAGYDHKAMGITARGGWVSVRRHLRELGIDPAVSGITAVGIGDMSGDVFGNGMLLEPNLKLVAAFDHRHIFLDPEPDPAVSLAERRRLFNLPRSSWEDYDESLVSTGGGVWGRQAKFVRLSPQVRQVLAVDAESLTPDEVIQAILRAPVDLLWNGGIGTYVRASDEPNGEVGDKANDSVRITAPELRCKIVGEGGNLGFTQPGRVEYARLGGRIFTDAIDNSAGVDTSDHEVNIKILLDKVVSDGALTARQRDELLGEMADEVARHVLADNEGQTLALTIAASQATSMAPVHVRLLASLERSGRLNRTIEHLPSGDELRERIEEGAGLTTPELAVLMAYAKSALYGDILASDAPEDGFLANELQRYFPAPLRARYSGEMALHPLRREIVATRLTNEVVNRAGITFVFRLSDETGAAGGDVVRAHAAAHEIFGVGAIWSRTERLDVDVPAAVQRHMFMEARTLTERAARRLLNKCPRPLEVATTVDHYGPGLRDLADHLPELVAGPVAEHYRAEIARLTGFGVPEALAGRVAGLPILLSGLDVVDIALAASCELEEAAAPYFALGELLSLDWLGDRIAALPRDDRWQGLARAALREDLYSVRAAITAGVLAGGGPGRTGSERVRYWLDRREPNSGRCRTTLDEIVASGRTDLSTLSVAVREVRNLAAQSRPA